MRSQHQELEFCRNTHIHERDYFLSFRLWFFQTAIHSSKLLHFLILKWMISIKIIKVQDDSWSGLSSSWGPWETSFSQYSGSFPSCRRDVWQEQNECLWACCPGWQALEVPFGFRYTGATIHPALCIQTSRGRLPLKSALGLKRAWTSHTPGSGAVPGPGPSLRKACSLCFCDFGAQTSVYEVWLPC